MKSFIIKAWQIYFFSQHGKWLIINRPRPHKILEFLNKGTLQNWFWCQMHTFCFSSWRFMIKGFNWFGLTCPLSLNCLQPGPKFQLALILVIFVFRRLRFYRVVVGIFIVENFCLLFFFIFNRKIFCLCRDDNKQWIFIKYIWKMYKDQD